jgi:hypothetical protein
MLLRQAFLLLVPLCWACQSADKPASKSGEQAEAEAPVEQGPVPQSVVNFKIDGKKLPPIDLAEETELLSIKELPPLDQWKRLVVSNEDGLDFRASQPAQLTGARTMKLVRLADGSYDFLVTQRNEAGVETIRNKRSKVKVVEILSPSYQPPPPNQGPPKITIKVGARERVLEKLDLDKIERRAEPGGDSAGDSTPRDTWLLLDLLGIKASELQPGQSVRMLSRNTKELVLQRDDLLDSARMHIIKLNRRGKFHYRGWTLGDAPARSSELRNLVEIELK